MNPLLPALLVSAALAVAAAPWALDQPLLAFVFKPLATLVVIAHAGAAGATHRCRGAGCLRVSSVPWQATWPCCGHSKVSCRGW